MGWQAQEGRRSRSFSIMAVYSSPRSPWRRWAAWGLLTLGLALVSLTAAHFVFAAVARSQVYGVEASLQPEDYRAWAVQPPSAGPSASDSSQAHVGQGYAGPLTVRDYSAGGHADPSVPYEYAQQQMFNGLSAGQFLDLIGAAEQIAAPAGPAPAPVESAPAAAVTPDADGQSSLPAVVSPAAASPQFPERGDEMSSSARDVLGPAARAFGDDATPARQLRIPSIAVDTVVVEIRPVADEKGMLVWERPKWAAGHLAGTAKPGQGNNTVMAGHLESPIRREGNVFENLPEVRLLDSVYVDTDQARYEYLVVQKRVVEPNDLSVLDETADATLTLITCVPKGVYSHRLIVIAKLFKVEALTQTEASSRRSATP
ncbi:MAG: sortase [Dehalococcoidia bacterium]|nr:sortase [Dehalococcoidia bacterium]